MNSIRITSFTADGATGLLVTDSLPRFSFRYTGEMADAFITLCGRRFDASGQLGVPCPDDLRLRPYTDYTATLTVSAQGGAQDTASLVFRTGRLDDPWQAQPITDGAYRFTEKKVSPRVMVFRRRFEAKGKVRRAEILATALGVYELTLNGEKVGDRYFAPGFTSYAHDLQYQVYDVTAQLRDHNTLIAEVAGGWAVGSFVMTRRNRITAPRQSLLMELRLTYEDGTTDIIGTDESWEVSTEGPVLLADLYDGETDDANVDIQSIPYHAASIEPMRIRPRISAETGAPVKRHERFDARLVGEVDGKLIYDFSQNLAGVVEMRIRGRKGQRVVIRHAEILNPDGSLNTAFLRSAKATFTCICRDGEQTFAPRFTYMGFRYVSVEGAQKEDVQLCAWALYSDIREHGSFSCSSEMLTKLDQNIVWGAKSNFVEIPTDCPQRDERMGWTGDIAVFAPTACFHFDMTRFLRKWLRDVRSEQFRGGGIPNTVPAQGYGFPTTMPNMAVDFWDDACVLVPWAVYMASGDQSVLEEAYPCMEKYVKACRFWAGLCSVGKRRYVWHTPSVFHFGDWIAPDVPKMSQWQARSRWTATASLCNTSAILARASELLGMHDKAETYYRLSRRVADAYQSVLMDGDAKLKTEFQTGYVLPLYFHMLDEEHTRKAAAHLDRLVRENGYRIGTGFPGTPYILFALADNGYADTALRMLTCAECPSWLYEVRVGATTVWERWDGLDESGHCPIGNDGTGGMISYNHYASGAVGDFLYRRIAGLEATSCGYRTFRIRPLVGGGITWAKAGLMTPYGQASSSWRVENGVFTITCEVPCGTSCTLTMPGGSERLLQPGVHTLSEPCQASSPSMTTRG